jgi:uncharacterized protein
MRSFQLLFLLIFFAVYILTVIGSLRNIKNISPDNFFFRVKLFFYILNFAVLFGFICLYIYPFQPRSATSYAVYFIFNALLFLILVFNLPMSLSFLFELVLKRSGIRNSVLSFAGFILSVGFSVGLIYGTLAGSRQIKVEYVEMAFSNLPEEFNHYCLVQLSDFHLGGLLFPEKMLEKTVGKVQKINPDLILFTGDLVNNFATEATGLHNIVAKLTSKIQGFAVLGNHDYGDYTFWENMEKKNANFEAIKQLFEFMGLSLLNNENIKIKKGNDSIFIAGVENWGHPPFPQYADLGAALENISSESFTILMTHDPAHWESQVAGKKEIELTLAGHSHGLQWGIKLAGIPFSISYLTRKNWGGIYRSGNSVLYVNTGLGTVGMPWRLDMPAEITVITLKRSKID